MGLPPPHRAFIFVCTLEWFAGSSSSSRSSSSVVGSSPWDREWVASSDMISSTPVLSSLFSATCSWLWDTSSSSLDDVDFPLGSLVPLFGVAVASHTPHREWSPVKLVGLSFPSASFGPNSYCSDACTLKWFNIHLLCVLGGTDLISKQIHIFQRAQYSSPQMPHPSGRRFWIWHTRVLMHADFVKISRAGSCK